MKINVLAFGIAKDIIGSTERSLSIPNAMTIAALKQYLVKEYPSFEKLVKFDLAVDQEYRKDDFELTENAEVAIIPPVSGG